MSARRAGLATILRALTRRHGAPRTPLPRTPFAWVLWENVAYLVDDERRERAFRALDELTSLDPRRLLAASHARLAEVTRLGGMHPEARVARLQECAEIALELGGGSLDALLRLPAREAARDLKRFPSIGAPGAEKILMACGGGESLALESNGLRVLLRLGFGRESTNYATSYRSVQEALAPELPPTSARRLAAHQLLRTHGQQTCRRNAPACEECPLERLCPSAR